MIPVRTCVGCRERHEQRSMVRFTRAGQSAWMPDGPSRQPGRGAYICSAKCAARVAKNKRYPGLAAAAEFLVTDTP
ncbi:MAG: YlxR family protein [Vulcanimicrobiaceae bacterium]